MNFDQWWNEVGSALRPEPNEDQEEHSKRICMAAFGAGIVPQGMKLIHWSEEDAEKGATGYIMNAVHEYGIACVNLHIRNREGFGNVEDERKHQQSIWCAIRDMVNNEIQMLQDACENQSEQLSYWKGLALKDSKPMTNQLTGKPL